MGVRAVINSGGTISRMPLTANIERLPNNTAVVTLQGALTLGTSLKIADSQIQSAIAEGVKRMVLDLTGVNYIDSAGLGLIVYVYGILNDKQGMLRICGLTSQVQSLLHLTRTDTFLAVDGHCEESLAALN